ncbi:MAG: SprT family zinc-dependent metalloprotease [Myxococcota bacterium]|nr:SprT family zinc-dependent metalloprotease [Myxococcota bacterium]
MPDTVQIRPSKRAKRMSIRVKPNGVFLTLPKGFSLRDAAQFYWENVDWIEENEARVQTKFAKRGLVERENGRYFLFRGTWYNVVEEEGKKAWVCIFVDQDVIRVSYPPMLRTRGDLEERLKDWVADQTLAMAKALSEKWASNLQRQPKSIRLGRGQTTWGTCSTRGIVRLHKSLAQAPPPVLEYVLAHELAHLCHMNHSRAFWAEVARIFPEWEAGKRKLRAF